MAQNRSSLTPHEQAVINLAIQAVKSGEIQTIKATIGSLNSNEITDLMFELIEKEISFSKIKENFPISSILMEKEKGGRTLIVIAAQRRQKEYFELLLDECQKQKDNNKDDCFQLGRALLHIEKWVELKLTELIGFSEILLNSGAKNIWGWADSWGGKDTKEIGENKNTLLHRVASKEKEYLPLLKMLLLHDPDDHLNEKNFEGKLPIEIAKANNNNEFLEILVCATSRIKTDSKLSIHSTIDISTISDQGYSLHEQVVFNLVFDAVEKGDTQKINVFNKAIDAKKILLEATKDGKTLIVIAVQRQQKEYFKLLLDKCQKQKDNNKEDCFQLGRALLHIEKWIELNLSERIGFSEILFNSGAKNIWGWADSWCGKDTKEIGESKNTLLHRVASKDKEYLPLLKMLLLHDPDDHLNEKNLEGKLPIEIAGANNNAVFISELASVNQIYQKKMIQELLTFKETPTDVICSYFFNKENNGYLDESCKNNNGVSLDEIKKLQKEISIKRKFEENPHARTLLRFRCALEMYESKHPDLPLSDLMFKQMLYGRSSASITFFREVKENVQGLKICDTFNPDNKKDMADKVSVLRENAEKFLQECKDEKSNACLIGKKFSLFVSGQAVNITSSNSTGIPTNTASSFSGAVSTGSSSSSVNSTSSVSSEQNQEVSSAVENKNGLAFGTRVNF